eukprot:jgi/Botrbrau1/11079/Bobra.0302s0021.1
MRRGRGFAGSWRRLRALRIPATGPWTPLALPPSGWVPRWPPTHFSRGRGALCAGDHEGLPRSAAHRKPVPPAHLRPGNPHPEVLYDMVVEVDEQVILPLGDEPGKRAGNNPVGDAAAHPPGGPITSGITGEAVCIRKAPDLATVRQDLQRVLEAGIRSLAVVFKHAAIYPEHEEAVGRWRACWASSR